MSFDDEETIPEGSNRPDMLSPAKVASNRRRVSAVAWGTIAVALALVGRVGRGPLPALSAPQAAGPGLVEVAPASPVQGDTLIVVVSVPGSADVRVRWEGRAVRAFSLPDGSRRALIGTDPNVATGTHRLAVTVIAGTNPPLRLSRSVRIRPGHFAVRNLTLPPSTFGLITPQNLAAEGRAIGPVLNRRTPEAFWVGTFQAPSTGLMDSPYGDQGVYNGHREWWHQGVDFSASAGAPVVAANAGVVALAQALPLGGNTVVIDHGQGVLTEYLHLSAFAVRAGTRVDRGTLIGRIGATGLVTGPSLHWGLYVNGTWVNPLFWMEPRPGLTS